MIGKLVRDKHHKHHNKHHKRQNKHNGFFSWGLFWWALIWIGIGLWGGSGYATVAVTSEQAILIDLTTNTVLYEKNADVKVAPSSMSKIMTVYLAFEELKAGRLSMDTTYTVSQKAWRKGGTKTFLPVNAVVKVSDLLRGIIVQSGNDASIALAEGMMGSEEAFAEQMTRRAHELGAVNTVFLNATGWPDPGHVSTMRDLALIAQKTIENFPEYYPLYKEIEFTYNNIRQMNRNPLLYVDVGCDGLKTGHTDAGGYGLVASAVQEGRRLILAINGAKSMKARAEDAKTLIRWGFSYYASPKLLSAAQNMGYADVWLGQEAQVPLQSAHDYYVTVPRHQLRNIKVEVVYQNPVPAPVMPGQVVGKVIVTVPDKPAYEVPLKTAAAVARAGFFSRIRAAIQYLVRGHN
jgi:D-alanyl-D-alanine carboxypeptidase (penicillin-binding protein 5/6)